MKLVSHWRWHRVEQHFSTQHRATRNDDTWIHQGLQFLRCHTRQLAGHYRRCRACPHTIIHAAHSIFTGEEWQRAAIEARMLARQPFPEIAQREGFTVEVLEAYSALFFDIAPLLDKPILISTVVANHEPGTPFRVDEYGKLIRLIGYLRGPLVLDVVLRSLSEPIVIPEDLRSLTTTQIAELADVMYSHTLTLAYTRPGRQLHSVHRAMEFVRELASLSHHPANRVYESSWHSRITSALDTMLPPPPMKHDLRGLSHRANLE